MEDGLYVSADMIGTFPFLISANKAICEALGELSFSIREVKGNWRLSYRKTNEVLMLLKWMYDDSEPNCRLNRKYEKAMDILASGIQVKPQRTLYEAQALRAEFINSGETLGTFAVRMGFSNIIGNKILVDMDYNPPPLEVDAPKLDAEKVKLMRARYSQGEKINALAREFGVSFHSAKKAIFGITYKDVV